MLERLQFSLPIATTIDAPPSIVWDVLTDVPSYPVTLSSVLKVESVEPRRPTTRSSYGDASAASSPSLEPSDVAGRPSDKAPLRGSALTASITSLKSNASAPSSAAPPPPGGPGRRAALGSKYDIARRSVVEGQRYSARVTVTRYKEGSDERSFTMSTHRMLGATCSLTLVARPAERQPEPSASEEGAEEPTRTEVAAIMTMIPYKYFVELAGIMCCLCFLKRRARLAMERDLDDLADACERRFAAASSSAAAGDEGWDESGGEGDGERGGEGGGRERQRRRRGTGGGEGEGIGEVDDDDGYEDRAASEDRFEEVPALAIDASERPDDGSREDDADGADDAEAADPRHRNRRRGRPPTRRRRRRRSPNILRRITEEDCLGC
ncbi:hypothetical protein ACHAWF_016968 [Thalassiosira exigua]